MGGRKSKKKGGGSGSGGSGGSGGTHGRVFCGEAAAAVSGSAGETELRTEPWTEPDRNEAPRPTAKLEIEMAQEVAKRLVDQKVDLTTAPLETGVPTIDLPNVVAQMLSERERFLEAAKSGRASYHDLTRYGLFLKSVRERLAEEHKRALQRQQVAKALADRAQGGRELAQRSASMRRCSTLVAKLTNAAGALNTHVVELQASPLFVRGMAELRARDMVSSRRSSPGPSGNAGDGVFGTGVLAAGS